MILDDILAATRERVRALEVQGLPPAVKRGRHRSLAGAISRPPGKNAIIAELKFASPAQGLIRPPASPAQLARDLVSAGCCALSVLTEPRFFGGTPEYLALVREAVEVPVLRKDFIIDPVQLEETAFLGADAVLLIASILGDRLPGFVERAKALGIEPLVEVHTGQDIGKALSTSATLIAVNNRDLRTMNTDLEYTLARGPELRLEGKTVISASGIIHPSQIHMLRRSCDAFLIGTSIMEAADPVKTLEGFVRA